MTKPDLSYIHTDLHALALPITTLTPDPKNARKHDRRNLDAIKASLEKFGMRSPIVVQRCGGALVVRAGNGRLAVAQELGWTHLPAVVFEDGDDEAVAYAIADNRTAELAEWDWEAFSELRMLHDSAFEVGLGWSPTELAALDPLGEVAALDVLPELPQPTPRKFSQITFHFTTEQASAVQEALNTVTAAEIEGELDANPNKNGCKAFVLLMRGATRGD